MAIIGRLACPWCGFAGAHVKCNAPKRPYHHCPDCGFLTPAKNGHQEKLLKSRMEPTPGYVPAPPGTDSPIVVAGGAKPAAAPVPAPAPAAPPKPATWLDQFLKS